MTETIIDGEQLTGGGDSVSGTYKPIHPSFGKATTWFLDGDANASDVTVEFFVQPQAATYTNFYELPSEATNNVDLGNARDNRRAFKEQNGVRGAGVVEVRITDNRGQGADATTLSVHVDEHDD